jgi:hypothetical protein
MGLTVKNGTPIYGPSLCETCTHAHIEKGYRASEELVFCTANYPVHRVPFAVRDCTSYIDKMRQNLHEMERIAWTLSPRGPKRQAGFSAPGGTPGNEEIELILDGKKIGVGDRGEK